MERRKFLGLTVAATLPTASHVFGGLWNESLWRRKQPGVKHLPKEEAFWRDLRSEYNPPADYADLDHANTAPTPRRVFEAYIERAKRLSRAPAENFGKMWEAEVDQEARPALARYLGVETGQLAFVANATTGLNTVLRGFPLKRGDEIVLTNHEYPDMVETVLARARLEGVVPKVVAMPEGAVNSQDVVDRIAQAITPKTRLLLISHVSAWSGLVLPVAEVCAYVRERGVAVLVDAAQSVGLLNVNFTAMGCDFLAASLHKGLGAPLPTGVLLMRSEHVGIVEPLHRPSWDTSAHPLDLYEWSGTFNVAGIATVKDALDFQLAIGPNRKLERLLHLSSRWQEKLADIKRVRLLTPPGPGQHVGAAAFAIDGVDSATLARQLRSQHRVLVQNKAGRHSPFRNAIRVSPGAHSTIAEIDQLVEAIRAVVNEEYRTSN